MNTKAKTSKAAVAGGVVAVAAGLGGTTVLVGQLAAEKPEPTTAGRQELPADHYTWPTFPDIPHHWFDAGRDRDDQVGRDSDINARPENWRRLMNEVDDPTPRGSEQDAESNSSRDDGWLEYDQIALGGLGGVAIALVTARTIAGRRRHPIERGEGEFTGTELEPVPDRFRESEFDFYGEILESPRRGGR